MKPYTYLIIDLACILIPFLVSFYPKYPFYKKWKYFFPANLIIAFIFLIWDYYFTEMGIWGFNPDYLTGYYILNLPIEEVLFFICIPYACVFTYFSFKILIKNNPLKKHHTSITNILSPLFLLIGIFHLNLAYTSATFILTSLFLLYCLIKKVDLSYIYLSYIAILPFFFLSNGILTGSLIEEPIVWYNNDENLGFRMFTIPIEDTFYGFLLIASIIYLYEFFQRKRINDV